MKKTITKTFVIRGYRYPWMSISEKHKIIKDACRQSNMGLIKTREAEHYEKTKITITITVEDA